jgi:hypothetical protein
MLSRDELFNLMASGRPGVIALTYYETYSNNQHKDVNKKREKRPSHL